MVRALFRLFCGVRLGREPSAQDYVQRNSFHILRRDAQSSLMKKLKVRENNKWNEPDKAPVKNNRFVEYKK